MFPFHRCTALLRFSMQSEELLIGVQLSQAVQKVVQDPPVLIHPIRLTEANITPPSACGGEVWVVWGWWGVNCRPCRSPLSHDSEWVLLVRRLDLGCAVSCNVGPGFGLVVVQRGGDGRFVSGHSLSVFLSPCCRDASCQYDAPPPK